MGVSVQELRTARESGQSLSEFAQGKGISRDDLLAIVTADLQERSPQGTQALTAAQAAEMAASIIDRKPGAGGPPPGAPPHAGQATPGVRRLQRNSIQNALKAALAQGDGEGLTQILDRLEAEGVDT